MQVSQLASMIEWLDEERRRDKALIVTLEERIAQQVEFIDSMQRRVKSVETDQSAIRQETLHSEKENEIIERMRQEMAQMLENAEARRLTAEREADRRLELQRESLSRSLREIALRADALEKQLAAVGGLQSEGDRLGSAMRALNQQVEALTSKLEGPDRRLTFLEEQRRTDARRLTEIETELPEYKKSVDSVLPKLGLIEDLALRNERRINDQAGTERERREQIQQFIDQQQLQAQQRDQQMTELNQRFSERDLEMKKNIERFDVWAQAYREMRRIIDDFNRIGERLERRINEVAEMQRLSEERFRHEWSEWREEDQKRWKQLTLSNDEVWRNHDREYAAYVKRITALESLLPEFRGQIERLWQLERARADLYREGYQSLLHEYDRGNSQDAPTTRSQDTIVIGERAGG